MFKDERFAEGSRELLMQSVLIFKMCFHIHIKYVCIMDGRETVCDVMHRNAQKETVIA